jgi:hypothetical protein
MSIPSVFCFIKKLSVILRDGDDKTNKIETANLGNSGNLTSAQLKLLQSADYRERSLHTGNLENNTWMLYLTVVPENQTIYFRWQRCFKEIF